METNPSNEKPLNGAAKAALMCGAGATILLFYIFALASILLLLVLVTLEFGLVIAALRFGLAGVMIALMRRHMSLLGVFLKSFRSRKRAEFRIELQPADAPGLFASLQKLCGQLAIKVPDTVSLEMSVNAWVRLKGFRRGSGATTLGIGYDLLAGLTQAEAEAVLAHEMTHAKLIRRGFKRWLSVGLNRMATLTRALSGTVEAYRRAKQSFELAQTFLSVADWLTKLGARQVSAYSRQDEFEADFGAAELCGSAPIRSSLLKLDGLARLASRLPWRERVAQLQLRKEGFSDWLVKELALNESLHTPDTAHSLFDKYSTHPLLRDRLAALPPATGPARGSPEPAIRLLAEPDKVAEKLVAEIQRIGAEEEQKDSKLLRRSARKYRAGNTLQPVQLFGVVLIIAGIIWGIAVFAAPLGWINLIWTAALIVAGGAVIKVGHYRDRVALPVPDYAALKAAWLKNPATPTLAEDEKKIEAELRAQFAAEKKSAKKAVLLAAESYASLGRCEYLRAHVAGRLCRELNKQTVEGALALAVASAALHNQQQSGWAQLQVRRATGVASPSTVWGVGWAALLLGDWAGAETFLDQACQRRPDEPTFAALLAIAQSRRGKMQSAILSARHACEPQPRNKEYAKLLIDLLLDGGYLREAQERLLRLDSQIRTDHELMFSMVRVRLMHHDLLAAQEWTLQMQQNAISSQMLIRLGGAYEIARSIDQAQAFYQLALAAGHYPEALMGLGRLEAERRNHTQARQHLMAALDVKRPVGEGGLGPLPLFHRIMGQLLALQEPALNCRSWIAKFAANVSLPAVANRSFVIFAPARQDAERQLLEVVAAMQPGVPPPAPSTIRWQTAPKDQQPDGPVRPGIQAVFGG